MNVARNLRVLGYTPLVNEEAIKPVEEHFTAIAKRDGLAIGKPFAYDISQYSHQVPGGVISNLRHQLRVIGMEDKLPETLEEAARVRADFGYPIMVTPLSQFVVSQAAINVIVGERYKEVTDQVIQYALGIWGHEAPAIMNADVKDKILNRRRAKDWHGWTAAGSESPSGPPKTRRYGFRRRAAFARLRWSRSRRCNQERQHAKIASERQANAARASRTAQ